MSEKKEVIFHLRTGKDSSLPLRESPVRFAVINENGLSSNAWRVWTAKAGDVYIACRDHMKDTHISLHQSGHQQVTSVVETAEGTSRQRGGRWQEPAHYGDPCVAPSFQLLFPNSALVLPHETRLDNPGVWDTNQVFVETDGEYPLTVIGFYILNKGLTLTSSENHSYPLAILPLQGRADKTLWVIATQGPEGNLREVLRRTQQKINQHDLRGPQFEELENGRLLSGFFTGPVDNGGYYGIVVPMTWRKRSEDIVRPD